MYNCGELDSFKYLKLEDAPSFKSTLKGWFFNDKIELLTRSGFLSLDIDKLIHQGSACTHVASGDPACPMQNDGKARLSKNSKNTWFHFPPISKNDKRQGGTSMPAFGMPALGKPHLSSKRGLDGVTAWLWCANFLAPLVALRIQKVSLMNLYYLCTQQRDWFCVRNHVAKMPQE